MNFDIEANRLLVALTGARGEVQEALRCQEGEDDAIASLYAAEDALLVLLNPSPGMRMVQVDIRLRRLGVAAERAEEQMEIEEIRSALADAARAPDAAEPTFRDHLTAALVGACSERPPEDSPGRENSRAVRRGR